MKRENSSCRQRERKKGRERQKSKGEKNISKFKHGFLESVALCVCVFFKRQPSSEPTEAFPEREINIDNKKPGPFLFCFCCFFSPVISVVEEE